MNGNPNIPGEDLDLNEGDLTEILDSINPAIRYTTRKDPFTDFLHRMKVMIDNEDYNGMNKLFSKYFITIKDEDKKLFNQYQKLSDYSTLRKIAKTINEINNDENIKNVLNEEVGEDIAQYVFNDYKKRGLLDEIKANAIVEYLRKEDRNKITDAFNEWRVYISKNGSEFFEDKIARYLR